MAVCSESKDKYPEVAAILASYVAQLLRLRYTGVVVGGYRRAVRVFVNSDFPAITNTVGHTGHTASMRCPCCLGMKCPTESHALLVWAFGTLQDLDYTHPPRTAAHLREMQEAYGGFGRTPAELGLATHMSVERSPVIVVATSQIVPLPLHLTIGLTARLLRLAIEAVAQERGSVDSRQFAHRQAAKLCVNIGVEPVPYHEENVLVGTAPQSLRGAVRLWMFCVLSCLLPGSPPMSARGSSGEGSCHLSTERRLFPPPSRRGLRLMHRRLSDSSRDHSLV